METTPINTHQFEAIVPNIGVFMERISYRARRIEEYRNNPGFTPVQRLRALLTIDDEFDWIVHLRQIEQAGKLEQVQAILIHVQPENQTAA